MTQSRRQPGIQSRDMRNSQDRFFRKSAAKKRVRLSVRSICIWNHKLLVQRPSDDLRSPYAFVGGSLEFGELLEDRVRREYMEELGRKVTSLEYLFLVENRFRVPTGIIHSLEHYFLVTLDSYKIESREPHLQQFWLPIKELRTHDVRPRVVRDAICLDTWRDLKHLVVPFK
jgi:ADP-ribose pyrophosphatase YjhB (NUDIX family)